MTVLMPAWLSWPQTRVLVDALGEQLRFVGGAVRDTVLERPVVDIDVATPLLPEAVLLRLEQAGIKAIPTGLEHGTVTAVIDGKHFEITTLRYDLQTNGRHAQVAFTQDWEEDAKRRDFTMNALYLSPQGQLFDSVGGLEDARAGQVRFIGDAYARIQEDYLRILRFFRFHAHYGKGAIDSAGLAACHASSQGLLGLSGERIQHEMVRLLAAPYPHVTLGLMGPCVEHGFGISSLDMTRLANIETAEVALMVAPSALRRLAALIAPEEVAALASRWKLSGEMKKALQTRLTALAFTEGQLTMAQQKSLLRRVGREVFEDVVLLACAQSGGADISPYQAMLEWAQLWQPPLFPITGKDLLLLGMQEGKAMGESLAKLEALWEASDYQMTREELLEKRL
jgi:poly(A) polymerase